MSCWTELMLSNIQIKLKEKGMLKKELEKKCGVRTGYIGRKDSRYTIELICEMAKSLGVSPGELLFVDFRNNTHNQNKIIAYFDKLIKETEQGRLYWSTYNDLMSFIFTSDDPLCGSDIYLYKRKFDDNFGKEGQLHDVAHIAWGFGREFRLIKAKVDGVDGWELYSFPIDEDMRPIGDAVGIYSTFTQNNEYIKYKIYDLVQAILMSKKDTIIDIFAAREITEYLQDEKEESEIEKTMCCYRNDNQS